MSESCVRFDDGPQMGPLVFTTKSEGIFYDNPPIYARRLKGST